MALDTTSAKKLTSVNPLLARLANRAAEISSQSFAIVQGARTQAQQDALYAQGRTRPGKIVTWTRHSRHIGGNAIDFAATVNGKTSWNDKLYPAIGAAFKRAALELGIPIVWGGDWRARDWGHIQLAVAMPKSLKFAQQGVTDMNPSEIMDAAKKLYNGVDRMGLNEVRPAAKKAAELIYYLAKLQVGVAKALPKSMKLTKTRKPKAKKPAAKRKPKTRRAKR